MTDVTQKIQELRQRVQSLHTQRAQAEHQRQVAQASVAQFSAELQAEFGATTEAEGQALLVQLDEQIAQQAAVIQQHLAQAGGAGA